MGLVGLREICEGLAEHGLDPATPAALVEQGTTERQRVIEGTLATLADRVDRARVEPPTLVIVGDVVRLRGKLDWFRTDTAGGGDAARPGAPTRPSPTSGPGRGPSRNRKSRSGSEPEPAHPAGDAGRGRSEGDPRRRHRVGETRSGHTGWANDGPAARSSLRPEVRLDPVRRRRDRLHPLAGRRRRTGDHDHREPELRGPPPALHARPSPRCSSTRRRRSPVIRGACVPIRRRTDRARRRPRSGPDRARGWAARRRGR